MLAAIGQPYVSGLHRHQNAWVYVSRGTGYWGPPVRIGARSEVTLFTLRRA
jgi:predicted MPP superfamily phosphohydrolase